MPAAVNAGPRTEGVHHIGHSTHWVVMDGVCMLTDPWVTQPTDRFLYQDRAFEPLPTDPDIVFISHAHGDHYDPAALDLVSRDALVFVPRDKHRRRLEQMGFTRVVVPAPDSQHTLDGVVLTIVRGKHLGIENVVHVQGLGGALFFGGDTMLTSALLEFADRYPASMVILPAERSTFFGIRSVMGPDEARELADRFGAVRGLLTHHESRIRRRHPLSWFARLDVAGARELDDRFVIPRPGDHVGFPWGEGEVA